MERIVIALFLLALVFFVSIFANLRMYFTSKSKHERRDIVVYLVGSVGTTVLIVFIYYAMIRWLPDA